MIDAYPAEHTGVIDGGRLRDRRHEPVRLTTPIPPDEALTLGQYWDWRRATESKVEPERPPRRRRG